MTAPLVVLSQAHVGARGAISTDGDLVEEPYSLRVCLAAQPYLEAVGCRVQVVRLPNVGTDGKPVKAPAINRLRPTCAVEPHLNALRKPDAQDEDHDGDYQELIADPKGRGHMVAYHLGSKRGLALAQAISGQLSAALPGSKVWGPQPAPGPMIYRKRLVFTDDVACPSVIPELLFLTNVAEVRWLTQPQAPGILGRALAAGVLAWLRESKLLPGT